MPFRNRNYLRPIITEKHEVTWSLLAADHGTADIPVQLVKGVPAADTDNSIEVTAGHHVRSIYIEMNIAAQTITNPKVYHWKVEVFKKGQTNTSPNTYFQDDKSSIIKRGMEMLPSDVGTVFKRVFVVKIPKRSQRIGLGDSIFIFFRASSTETVNNCGFSIYKAIQ